jgi:hypothetical protein
MTTASAPRRGRKRRRHRPGRRAAPAGLVMAAAMLASSCGGPGTAAGHALDPGALTTDLLAPLKPGDEVGMLFVDLDNTSNAPLTLQSVSFPGRGVGTFVRIVQVEIGPSIAGKIPPSEITKGVPGGTYRTDPPVSWWPPTRTCGKQVLDPVRGYILPPRGIARVWVVLQATRAGRYRFGHVLHYSQSGRQYQEVIQEVVHGRVAPDAPYIPVDSTEKTCLKKTKTRLLPYP